MGRGPAAGLADLRRHARLAGGLGAVIAVAIVVQALALAAAIAAGLDGRGWAAAATPALIAAGAIAVRAGLTWTCEVTGRRAGTRAMAELRGRLVAATLDGAPVDRGDRRAGELAALTVQGGEAVARWAGRVVPQLALAVLVPIAALATIVVLDPLSAALLAPTIPLLIVFLVLAGSEARRVADERLAALSLLGAHLLDVVRGLPVLRSLGREHVQEEQLAVAGEAYRVTTLATLRSAFVSAFALEFIAMLGTALVAVVAGVRLVNGTMEFQVALGVLLLAPELYAPLRRVGVEYHAAADAKATLARVAEAADGPALVPRGAPVGAVADPAREPLVLESVSVRAPGGERTILDAVDLRLEPGEVVAVVGASGAGKSTLVSLLLALRAPDAGTVRCGPTTLGTGDVERWRAQVAWLPQRPVVAPRSLADNLRLADPHAGADALWRALGRVGLADWARALPGGLDARLGDGGVAISAGERRRLGLARVALRDARLILADEPTANLDATTAALVSRTLAELVAGRTAVLVTHEPDLLALADRTITLDAGMVVREDGPVAEAVPA